MQGWDFKSGLIIWQATYEDSPEHIVGFGLLIGVIGDQEKIEKAQPRPLKTARRIRPKISVKEWLYHKSRAQQQAMQRLGHIGSMNVAVVRVAVFAVSFFHCRQELGQTWDGDLQSAAHNPQRSTRRTKTAGNKVVTWNNTFAYDAVHVRINTLTSDYTGNWTSECVVIIITRLSHFSSNMLKLLPFYNDVLSGECSEIKKIKTLKRLLSPYLVISSKKRVCSAWSELAEFRANTSKLQRSTSCEGGESDCIIDAYLWCVYDPLCDVRFIAQTPGERWDL